MNLKFYHGSLAVPIDGDDLDAYQIYYEKALDKYHNALLEMESAERLLEEAKELFIKEKLNVIGIQIRYDWQSHHARCPVVYINYRNERTKAIVCGVSDRGATVRHYSNSSGKLLKTRYNIDPKYFGMFELTGDEVHIEP